MKLFWQSSPEWQRKQALAVERDQVREAKERAGRLVLACILADADSPHGRIWQERRQTYKDAVEADDAAFAAWMKACDAYEASPAREAERRYFADPIARASASVQEPA